MRWAGATIGYHWTDFHMEVGTLFEPCEDLIPDPLTRLEGLDFKRDPEPREENEKFGPVMYGMNPSVAPSLWCCLVYTSPTPRDRARSPLPLPDL